MIPLWLLVLSFVARSLPADGRVDKPREDGTCCWGTPSCGGVYAANVGGWGHAPRDLRFRDPTPKDLNSSIPKKLPRPYKMDITGGYFYNMTWVNGFVHEAIGQVGQTLAPGHDCPTCSPYWQIPRDWENCGSVLRGEKAPGPGTFLRNVGATFMERAKFQDVFLTSGIYCVDKSSYRRVLHQSIVPNDSSSGGSVGPAAYGEAARDDFSYEQRVGSDILHRVPVNAAYSLAAGPKDSRDTHVMRGTAHSGARRANTTTGPAPLLLVVPTITEKPIGYTRRSTTPGSTVKAIKTQPDQNITLYPYYPPAPPVPLQAFDVEAPSWYVPVTNYFVVPRLGNPSGVYDGLHIPICARHNVIPPTRKMPVPAPPAEILPPPPPETKWNEKTGLVVNQPTGSFMTCWDGTVCPGRVETPGIQCCSAAVISGQTCSQIFICDKKRACTGRRACYQAYESQWDVNNNGWQLAGIMAFISVMILFLCLFCLYCFCDRCVFNRRAYAAQRERKTYLKALPQLQSMA